MSETLFFKNLKFTEKEIIVSTFIKNISNSALQLLIGEEVPRNWGIHQA